MKKIRKELVMLPYYGCFDFLTFKWEANTVTLGGYAMRPTLKDDAERALKGLERVEKVVNEIEVLPLSPNDDSIRWGVFRAIYRDPFFARYAPGGGFYGRQYGRAAGGSFFGGPFERWNRPAGTIEPLGAFPIHVVVKNGNVLLVGIVDNKTDSDRANILANGVPGVFSVKNLLQIDHSQTAGKKQK
jgi:hyperosmotically inducible periplasmic protein